MRSAIYYGREDVRVEEVERPAAPEPGELRLAVDACGICGSDLHQYAHGPDEPPEEPHPITGERLPVPMGHEFAGAVTEVGEGVSEFTVGDRVAVNPVFYCGECRYCREAKYNLCDSIGFLGLDGGGGGFSEEVVVSTERAVRLPEDLPPAHGALVEPFSVGLHAVDRADLAPGASVAVFGAGTIGLTVIQAARAVGAGEIYAVEPREARRDIATTVGADAVIDPTDVDARAEVVAASDGGVDVAFEVAGVGQTMRDAVETTKHDGRIVVVSMFEGEVKFDPTTVMSTERTVTGSAAFHAGPLSGRDFGTVIQMFGAGRLDPEPLVTDRIDLDQIVESGFEALQDPESAHVKILVDPSR